MLPWKRKKKTDRREKPPQAPPHAPDDWAFLREQPDFDADEMASVHSQDAPELKPPPLPVEARIEDRVPPEPKAQEPRAFEPGRRPIEAAEKRWVAEPSLPAKTTRGATDDHATRPLTLLSELCARFEEAHPEGPARVQATVPGWTLTLEIVVGSRRYQRTISEETVIGRADPSADWLPDVDLRADETVSRRHARVHVRSARYWLQDLDSLNGTRHNGAWLQPGGETELQVGDEIVLGELCRLQVMDPDLGPADASVSDLLARWVPSEDYTSNALPESGSGDLLDVALARGSAVGLIPAADPS